MSAERIIHHDRASGVAFVYWGGAYIDVFWSDALAIRGLGECVDDPAVPFVNINVYDYAGGAPSIAFTRDAVIRKAAEWVEANRGDLGGYLEQSL